MNHDTDAPDKDLEPNAPFGTFLRVSVRPEYFTTNQTLMSNGLLVDYDISKCRGLHLYTH